ncbi:glycosyltransferase family 2 protein [Pectobacterium versatile]|uniref:glycosyltransferase family 2 protein n=1 Tax=Pectobacterium versatile TaxID=2488639 RepID=UPI00102E8DDB|nr:glycosyltransferase family 2 protein [Pectobacterium versatile]TAI84936.1 glycosyltransferase family 2 protein [Pectobacterium versatile]
MKVSLILCTLGRTTEVSEFIFSLLKQNYSDYELIIVDQNEDERISIIIDETQFPIEKLKHIKQTQPGLSRARNVGLQCADGDIIAFPDDDCCYDKNVLSTVRLFFAQSGNDYVAFCTNTKDATCDASLIQSPEIACDFTRQSLLGCSFTLFFDRRVNTFRFDERLGVGSGFIWGASEEHDFLFRVMGEEGKGYFSPNIMVYHPAKEEHVLNIGRAYFYGAGLAAFRLKHFSRIRFFKSAAFILWQSFSNMFSGRAKKSIFKFYFLWGYLCGAIAWRLTIR